MLKTEFFSAALMAVDLRTAILDFEVEVGEMCRTFEVRNLTTAGD